METFYYSETLVNFFQIIVSPITLPHGRNIVSSLNIIRLVTFALWHNFIVQGLTSSVNFLCFILRFEPFRLHCCLKNLLTHMQPVFKRIFKIKLYFGSAASFSHCQTTLQSNIILYISISFNTELKGKVFLVLNNFSTTSLRRTGEWWYSSTIFLPFH
jgi:hypothetical protein